MLASNGPHWFDRQPPDSRWPSIGISLGLTALLFAVALASMKSVGIWPELSRPAEPPVIVHLDPPAPPPKPKPEPVTRQTPSATAAPTVVPMTIAPPVVTPPSIISMPVPTPAPPRTDTTGPRAKQQPAVPVGAIVIPHNFGLADTAMHAGGAQAAPAGLTVDSRNANTAKFRDSVAAVRMLSIAELARTRGPTGAMRAELEGSQAQTDKLMRRATTAGAGNDVVILKGSGVNGVGAVNGGKQGFSMQNGMLMYSLPFTFLSMGPTPEQRKKNEKLYAEYLLYLRAQQDLLVLKRDSIRADSLRRDSLARRRIIP